MSKPLTTQVINEELIRECVYFEGNIKPGLLLGEDTLSRASGTVGLITSATAASRGSGGGVGGMRGQQGAQERRELAREQQDRIALHEVQCLMFSFKNIGQISNLVGVDNITKLCLDNNRISRIEGLDHLKHLKWLDLSFNKISVMTGLSELTQVENLSVHSNEIKEIANIETMSKLQCLALGHNKIENLDATALYLHQFRDLRMVSLVGNPIESASSSAQVAYRQRMLAYIRRLKFLDNRMISESEIAAARETCKETMMPIEEKDNHEDEAAKQKEAQEKDVRDFAHINCPNDATFFQEVWTIPMEGRDLVALLEVDALRDRVKELNDKHREDFTQICKELADQMRELRNQRDANEREFLNTLRIAKSECDQECRELIKNFERQLKLHVPVAIRAMPTQELPDQTDEIAEMRQKLECLRTDLMEHESDQLDAYESVIKEFEGVLKNHDKDAKEKMSNQFDLLREAEKNFANELKRRLDSYSDDKVRQAQDIESGYATSMPEHAASKDKHLLQLLEHKEEYPKVFQEWSELKIKRIEEVHSYHENREKKMREEQTEALERKEKERSRARIREISQYVERIEARIQRWENLTDAICQ